MSPGSEIVPCCSTLDGDKITSLLTVFFFNLKRIPLYRAAPFANFKRVLDFSVPSIILVKAGLMQITM